MERNRWWPVVGCGLVVFMATLDTSIVAVALPAVERALGVRTAAAQWAVLGYLVPLVALSLPAGRWLDRTGPRAARVLATGGFTLSSLAAGLAPGLGALVAARVVQGAFAAVLFALVPAVTVRAVRPELAGRASALVMTLGPLGAVSGPVLGGLIVQAWGWPWIFYINVPAGLVVIAIALASLDRDALARPDRAFAAEALLLATAATALLLALSLSASRGPAWLALALAAVPPLAWWWRTQTSAPFRRLARFRPAAAPVAAIMLNALVISLVEFLAPFYLQRVLHLSPVDAAATILAMPAAMVAAGPVGGLLGDRWGTSRTAAAGAAVTTAGVLLLVPAGGDLGWRLAVVGAGTGLFAGPSFAMLMARAPSALQGTAGAAQSLARQLGFSLGPALATLAWAGTGYSVAGMRIAFGVAAVAGLAAVPLPWWAGRAPSLGSDTGGGVRERDALRSP
ncbi:Riboflavin transporter RibZ [Actinomadura sp. RB99]|uniref:MFS transporter n=1 Tax=Actinomadura sp. RB99 TaxID=2691577 RepID=UPI001685032D|nr:MFS transporter [Actinomadura sp. RB99]MBD2898418.1 Riboflavin transporter RibZ [Actinomadura sp. RB99]